MRNADTDRRRVQAAYQRAYREKLKATRAPDRDDIARVVLHWTITEALKRDRDDVIANMERMTVKRLVEQGFDRDVAGRCFDRLLERYERGWDFQRKVHLLDDES